MKKVGLESTGLRIMDSIENGQGESDGRYTKQLIDISLKAANPMGTLRHETIHALKELGAFSKQEWSLLESYAKKQWINQFLRQRKIGDSNYYDTYKKIYLEDNPSIAGFDEYIIEEAIADAFKYFSATKPPANIIGNIYRKVKALLEGMGNQLSGLGFQTADDVFKRVEAGQMKPTQQAGTGAAPRYAIRNTTKGLLNPNIPLKNTKIINDVALTMGLTPEEFAATSLIHQTGRAGVEQFDSEKIGGLPDVVQFLEDQRRMSGLPLLDTEKPEDRKILAKLMATEALAAIRSGGSNLQWYDSIVNKMLAMAGLKYPELNTDINSRVAFKIATAVTSQGLNVEDNLAFAMRVYDQFRVNGKFPEIGLGKDQESMVKNFQLANYLLKDMKPNLMRQFLETEFTVEEMRSAGFSITGELGDETVLGSSVFGPKIGFGFYSNLNGNFDPVTMDMWFMRTIGRLTGKLKSFRQDLYDAQLNKFRNELDAEGGNGVFANQFDQNEVELAKVNDEAAEALVRKVKTAHERDYKVNRALFDNGTREKSKLVAASETIVKSLDTPKDAPSNGTERRNLRDVVRQMVSIVEGKYGKRVPPASLQAAIWYPEQELYKAMGVKLRVTSQSYAGAIEKILTGEGYGRSDLESAAKLGSRTAQRLAKSTVSTGTKKTGEEPIRLGPLQAGEKEALLYRGRRRVVLEEERISPKRKRVMLEVAPDPNNKALVNKWRALSNDQRINISDKIANEIVRDTLSQFGLKGYVDTQVGSYLDDTNPSFALYLDSGDSVAVAKFLGHALSQYAMTVISPKAGKGLDKTGAVRLNIGDATASEVEKIYQQLREIKVDGKSIIGGQSYINGNMVVLNYSDVQTDQLAKLIDSKLDEKYKLIVEDVYTAFPEKKDYNYANPSSDPRGNAGVLRQASRDLRSKATKLLEKELKLQSGKASKFSLQDSVEVDGVDRPTTDSRGKPIFSTLDGIKNFWRWFGDSVFVDDKGRPMVMYHGTAVDIEEFIPKQANAIFITPQVKFAADFKDGSLGGVATWSEGWMVENYEDILTPKQIERAKIKALFKIDAETKKDYKLTSKSHHSAFVETAEFSQELLDEMPSRANVLPLFVKADNPFNYENQNHVRQVVDRLFLDSGVDLETEPNGLIRFKDENGSIADKQYSENEVYKMLSKGYWPLIEQAETQEAIRGLEFDGFSVREALTKNYAVYDSAQLKSSIGNTGEFSPKKKSIRYSISQNKIDAAYKKFLRAERMLQNPPDGSLTGRLRAAVTAANTRLGKAIRAEVGNDTQKAINIRQELQKKFGSITSRGTDESLEEFVKSGGENDIRYSLAQTKTPEFKRWFGDSKAVDADGKPLVMYHGTNRDIESFSTRQKVPRGRFYAGELGSWFGSNAGIANVFSTGRYSENGAVYPVYLSVRNPKEFSSYGGLKDFVGNRKSAAAVRRGLEAEGYDGIVIRNSVTDLAPVRDDWVAFKPTQIKSATGNRGTFDPAKPDIRYSLREKADELKAMSEAERDEIAPGDFGYDAYVLYEAEKLMPPKDGAFKKLNGNNSFVLHNEADAVVNVDGNPFLATAEEDPDNEDEIIWNFSDPKESSLAKGITTDFSDKADAVFQLKQKLKESEGKPEKKYSLRDDFITKFGQADLTNLNSKTHVREEVGYAKRLMAAFSPDSRVKLRAQIINRLEAIERQTMKVSVDPRYGGSNELLADVSATAAALQSQRASGIAAESFKRGVPVYANGFTSVSDLNGTVDGLIPIFQPLLNKYKDPMIWQIFQFYSATRIILNSRSAIENGMKNVADPTHSPRRDANQQPRHE
jgi:hypothetical protein